MLRLQFNALPSYTHQSFVAFLHGQKMWHHFDACPSSLQLGLAHGGYYFKNCQISSWSGLLKTPLVMLYNLIYQFSVGWWHFLMLTLPLLIKSGVSDQYFCCIVIRDLVALSALSPIQILPILLILHHSCLVHWNHSSLTTIFANLYSNSPYSGSSQNYLQKLVGQPLWKPISSFSIHESHIYDFVSCPIHKVSPGTPRKNWESNQKSTSKVNKY